MSQESSQASAQSSSPMSEKRANERRPCEFATEFSVFGAEEVVWGGTVRDISELGIGVEAPRGFSPGTLLAFQLESVALLSVVHERPIGRGRFLGCRFLRPIDSTAVRAVANCASRPRFSEAAVVGRQP